MPDKIIGRLQRAEGLDGGHSSGLERVGCTFTNSRAQSVWAKRAHVTNHSELVGLRAPNLARSREAVRLITAHRHVEVPGIRSKAGEGHVVIPGRRGLVGDGCLRRG